MAATVVVPVITTIVVSFISTSLYAYQRDQVVTPSCAWPKHPNQPVKYSLEVIKEFSRRLSLASFLCVKEKSAGIPTGPSE